MFDARPIQMRRRWRAAFRCALAAALIGALGCKGQGTAAGGPGAAPAASDGLATDADRFIRQVEQSQAEAIDWAPAGRPAPAPVARGPQPDFPQARSANAPTGHPAAVPGVNPVPRVRDGVPPTAGRSAQEPAFVETTRAAGAAPAAQPAAGQRPIPPATRRPTTQSPPQPAAVPQPAAAEPRELVRRLSNRLRAESGQASRGLRQYLHRAALAMFDPTQQLLPADLHRLAPAERDLVLAYQRVFTQIGQQLGQNKGKDAQLLRSAVAELFEQLHPNQQRLRITAAKLCSSVRGYGQYTEMASTFLAGRRHAVGLYVELENYKAEIEKDGSYAVRLVQEVVLYNEADGLAVWRLRPARTVDRSRNKRRDFFTLQKIHLPQNLSVGRYRLSITLTDEVGQQADEAKIPLTILADPKLLPESRQ